MFTLTSWSSLAAFVASMIRPTRCSPQEPTLNNKKYDPTAIQLGSSQRKRVSARSLVDAWWLGDELIDVVSGLLLRNCCCTVVMRTKSGFGRSIFILRFVIMA
jgi:hypothetical protein